MGPRYPKQNRDKRYADSLRVLNINKKNFLRGHFNRYSTNLTNKWVKCLPFCESFCFFNKGIQSVKKLSAKKKKKLQKVPFCLYLIHREQIKFGIHLLFSGVRLTDLNIIVIGRNWILFDILYKTRFHK